MSHLGLTLQQFNIFFSTCENPQGGSLNSFRCSANRSALSLLSPIFVLSFLIENSVSGFSLLCRLVLSYYSPNCYQFFLVRCQHFFSFILSLYLLIVWNCRGSVSSFLCFVWCTVYTYAWCFFSSTSRHSSSNQLFLLWMALCQKSADFMIGFQLHAKSMSRCPLSFDCGYSCF